MKKFMVSLLWSNEAGLGRPARRGGFYNVRRLEGTLAYKVSAPGLGRLRPRNSRAQAWNPPASMAERISRM